MWQEQSYMGHESGFISASSTQANSVTGYDMEDGGGGGCYTGPGSIVSGPAMSQVSLFDLDSGAPSGKFLNYFFVIRFLGKRLLNVQCGPSLMSQRKTLRKPLYPRGGCRAGGYYYYVFKTRTASCYCYYYNLRWLALYGVPP